VRDDRRAQFFFKPLAALGFVLLALQSGALETIYGQIIIGGLVACAIGDVCLLFRNSQKLFMGGMLAFAMGHLAYYRTIRSFCCVWDISRYWNLSLDKTEFRQIYENSCCALHGHYSCHGFVCNKY